MVNIQSPTAEIRRGKRRRRRKKERRKKQDENIMVCPITYGDHNNTTDDSGATWGVRLSLATSQREVTPPLFFLTPS